MTEREQVRPARVRAVAVVVPAHDEEELLGRCLHSVEVAVAALREAYPLLTTTTLVVLDSCTDSTAEVVARHGVAARSVAARSVGTARRQGVRAAATACGPVPPTAVWIASTDADTVVPPGWLVQQVAAADAGAGLVVGAAVPDQRDLDVTTYAAWLLRHGPTTPPAVHGANLGVRLADYDAAGGFPPVREHEDVLLVGALRARGVREMPGLPALTSGRRYGRVGRGFAGYLRDLESTLGD
ncbi:glycosyltransferase [Nocardioides sp. AX2bis]|uniref:glycosyltransferase n=1 Tax=Nocardioides sp. AX2bis TaxID=2653157 RepID=UPI0012F2F8E0|nr:glycosyltransferase [Nocardioides sp. AX2bis]VXC41347.1 Glycosyltransferase [Nocardioides sp. AX2bis]